MPADITRETVTIKTKDGLLLAASIFTPSNTISHRVMVIGSALGVPRYFYYKFACFFAAQNFVVITFDYRGIYESRKSELDGSKLNFKHWGSRDIEAVLRFAKEKFSPQELVYTGHSCGGQLLGLAPSCTQIDKIVLVACQQGYWKLWPRPYNIGVFLFWQLLSLSAHLFEYIPTSKMGISSVDLPGGVAKQWASWGKTPGYLFNPSHKLEIYRYGKLRVPLLSYRFEDDLLLGPPKAVDALLERYKSAHITKREVTPSTYNQSKIGHFGFFKEQLKTPLWQNTLKWINS